MERKHLDGNPAQAGGLRGILLTFLLAAAFLFVVCLNVPGSTKIAGMIMIAAALVTILLRFSVLRKRVGAPFLALTLLTVMGGISTLYAVAPKFALNEFLKLLVAFCLAILLLAFAPGKGVRPGRSVASLLAACCALAGFISIDMIGTRIIGGPVMAFLEMFTTSYSNLTFVEEGVRLVSIFMNPNIFAGFMGLGVLLSLSLVLSAETTGERRVHLCLLFVNSLAFLLAFSMGASAAIAVGFVLYLILERKERRGALFVLMVETLVLVLIATLPISQTSLKIWDGIRVIPLLCVVLGAAVLCLLDGLVGQRVARVLVNRAKLFRAIILVFLAILVVFLAAALTLTGSAELSGRETLTRAAYPESGDYTMSAVCTGDVTVVIESQNQADTMMHTSTILYEGALKDAAFTVPEDSLVVFFTFGADSGATLDSVSYSDGSGSAKLPLDYKLLPGFIATRLQGLFANENAIQRTVFFRDGLKLFLKNPLFGRGLGAFENGVKSVQGFLYETKYVHNHYIQTLVETGVVGFILFLGLLVVSAIAILRELRKKEEAHPLAPALGAALIFMAFHAAVEMVFSAYSYLPTAFGVFVLIELCCGNNFKLPLLTKKVRTGIWVAIPVLTAAFAVLLGGNMAAENLVEKEPTFDAVERAIRMDRYERADYMLSYINGSILSAADDETMEQCREYMRELEKMDSNSIPRYLALYYLNFDEMEKALEMLEKYVLYVPSDSATWENAFEFLRVYEEDSQLFRDGVEHLYSLMLEWDEENLGSITISDEAQEFLDRICG